MLKKIILLSLLFLICLSSPVTAQKTIVKDVKAKTMLMGKHKLSLQWISWDYFGTVTISNKNGVLYLMGEQRQRGGSDFVTIDGKISQINSRDFIFVGKIITQINHINGGQSCTRDGEMTFRITGKRKYWRLMEMDNPCDEVTDYVDIYFR
jgi:hypothetical protein